MHIFFAFFYRFKIFRLAAWAELVSAQSHHPPRPEGAGKQSRLSFPLFYFAGSSNVNHCLACSQASVMLIDIQLFSNSVFIFVDNAINLSTYKKKSFFYRSFHLPFLLSRRRFKIHFFCELAKKFFSIFLAVLIFFFCNVLISKTSSSKREASYFKM